MASPVLPPDTAIVGASKVQPQWWRWFRDVNDSVSANASSIVTLGDAIGDAQATRVADVALTAGSNVVAHGFGSVPTTWWPGRPRGAFPSGGGSGIYPETKPDNVSSFFITTASNPSPHTMTYTPTSGRYLIGLFGRSASGVTITSIAQTGVTWILASRITGTYVTEVWIGEVTAASSSAMSITYGLTSAALGWHLIAEYSDISSATPTASANRDGNALSVANRISVDSERTFSTPPVANAGDLVLFIDNSSNFPVVAPGWLCNASGGFGTSSSSIRIGMFYGKTAQVNEHVRFSGYRPYNFTIGQMHMLCMPTNLAVVGAGGETPHGLREVSIDDTNLTVESISNVTVDLFFK